LQGEPWFQLLSKEKYGAKENHFLFQAKTVKIEQLKTDNPLEKIMTRILLSALLLAFTMASAADHAYIGTKKCALCHKGAKNNMVFETWKKAKHAKAWKVLASESAKAIAAEMGVTGNPQEAGECLTCHSTGYGVDPKLTLKLKPADGVTCEACHGAGGNYSKKPIMKVRKKAVMKGMVDDTKSVCTTCHDESLKHVKTFVYEERWEEISHELPEK
jgi:hypothetical protein